MTVTKQTTLRCDNCGKTASFVGDRPEQPGPFYIEGELNSEPPKNWLILRPNYEQSIWTTTDFYTSGDFCSPECIRDYLIKKIDERNNPKPIFKNGILVMSGDLVSKDTDVNS